MNKERKPGLSRGLAIFSDDFSDPLSDDIVKEFEK